MRVRLPSSRARIAAQFYPFGIVLAALAPLLALYLRNAPILFSSVDQVGIYVAISFIATLIGFGLFRVCGALPEYLSVTDALDIAKAVLTAESLTCAVMFSMTRLDGVPRSAPAIHALILVGGLFAARIVAHLTHKNRKLANRPRGGTPEHIVLIGLNDLAGLFMKLIDALDTGGSVVALLDENPRLVGRSLAGVPVFGPPEHLDAMIDEFEVHGVRIDRVVVAGDSAMVAPTVLDGVRRACARRNIAFDFVGDFFNLPVGRAVSSMTGVGSVGMSSAAVAQGIVPARYFRWKRLFETLLASLIILGATPLWLAGGALALLDVGAPLLFWQRRIGMAGHPFQLYKIRTLRFPVDRAGQLLSDQERVSWIGRLLRQARIDELPQLLSVLVGDMALIGPRPLLPEDQPADPSVRLMVRPGITGWAQVNGGSLLEPEEKEVLDAWYVCHASPWLDLRILGMTVRSLVFGDRRSERALKEAHRQRQIVPEFAPVRFVTEGSVRPHQDDRQTAVARSV